MPENRENASGMQRTPRMAENAREQRVVRMQGTGRAPRTGRMGGMHRRTPEIN